MKTFKKLFKLLFAFSILSLIALYGSDKLVKSNASDKVFESIEDIPHNKVGLLLGTIKTFQNGRVNKYYTHRINAAVKLFKAGKIDYILVSGDNSTKAYDEPTDFMNDLIDKGIPKNRIYLDYAGFRTLDSVIRAKEIFGQSSFTVISQKFHNERAIYIANKNDLNVVAFNAIDVNKAYGFKTQIREKFARVKMMLDLVTGKDPKFLGESIVIK